MLRLTDEEALKDVADELARARARWARLDETNTPDDYILYSIAYIGRATSAARNAGEDKRSMLIKAAGQLVAAAGAIPTP